MRDKLIIGGNMRAKNVTRLDGLSRKGRAQARLKAIRLMALGLCFITVFALTLAFGSGLIGDPNLAGNVVEAADWDITVENEDDWKSNPFLGDDGDYLDTSSANLTATWSNGILSLKKTDTFNSLVVNKENQSVRREDDSGMTSAFFGHIGGNGDAEANHPNPWWQASNEGHRNPANIAVGFYYQIPQYIYRACSVFDSVTLTVNFAEVASDDMESCDVVVEPKSSSTTKAGLDVLSSTHKFGTNKSASAKISGSDRYLLIGIGGRMNNHSIINHSSYVLIAGMTIDVNITSTKKMTTVPSVTFDDGASPVWANEWNLKGIDADSTEPYRTSSSAAGTWPVYDKDQLGENNYPLDSDGKYMSYQGKQLSTINGGKPYYKHTTISAIDAYSYSNIGFNFDIFTEAERWNTAKQSLGLYGYYISNTSAPAQLSDLTWAKTNYATASGIKTIDISIELDDGSTGESTIDLSEDQTDVTMQVEVNGIKTDVGYVKITKKDNFGFVVIDIYMYMNAILEVTTSDFGDLTSTTKRLQYGGIDPSGPQTPVLSNEDFSESGENYFYQGGNRDIEKNWYTTSHNLTFSLTTPESDVVVAPNFYYFEVYNFGDDISSAVPTAQSPLTWDKFPKKSDWRVAGIMTANQMDDGITLTYNFENGFFSRAGQEIHPSTNESEQSKQKGPGMYLFRVYAFDMAGNNMSAPVDYFVNVDYERPEYDAVISYTGKDGSDQKIQPADNGKWITSLTPNSKLTITPKIGGTSRFNISGNTLAFLDEENSKWYHVSAAKKGNSLSKHNSENGYSTSSAVYFAVNDLLSKKITLKITKSTSGAFEITFLDEENNQDPDMALNITFYLTSGQYDSESEFDFDTGYPGSEWKGGIKIFIDKTSPNPSGLSLQADDGSEPGETIIPTKSDDKWSANFDSILNCRPENRNWFYDSYLSTSCELLDDMLDLPDEYKNGYALKVGVKALKNIAEAQEFLERDFLNNYATYVDSAANSWFDRSVTLSANEVGGSQFSIDDIDLRARRQDGSTMNAGLRLIFIWFVDQAGNCSDIKIFGVYVDTTSYNVTAKMGSSALLEKNSAEISTEDGSGILRGQPITLSLSISDGYVPFKLAFAAEEDGMLGDVLLENYGSAQNGFAPAGVYGGLLSGYNQVDSGVITITFNFDTADFDDISKSERTILFQHRLVVNAALGTNSNRVDYKVSSGNAAEAISAMDLAIVVNDINDTLAGEVRKAFALRYVDNTEEHNPLYVKNDDDRAFTSNIEEAKSNGETPVPFAAINVGTYYAYAYIPRDNEAFVLASVQLDENNEIAFSGAPAEITIAKKTLYVVPNEGSEQYGLEIELSYGLYTSLDASEDTIFELAESEGTLTGSLKLDLASAKPTAGTYAIAYDEAFAVSGGFGDNYDIAFISGKQFVVEQRRVEITILAETKTYGDADPVFAFGVRNDQFGVDELEAILAEIFEGFTKSSESLEGYTTYQSIALSREQGEDVGSYAFSDDLTRLVINSNYTLALEEGQDERKFEITKRTVQIEITGSTLLPYAEDPQFDKESATPGYKLAAKDDIALVRNELAKLLQGGKLFVLGEEPQEGEPLENYSKTLYYEVSLGAYDSQNITLEIADGANKYYVYVAAQSVVIISVKSDARFEFTFGDQWNENSSIAFSASKFTLTKDGTTVTYAHVFLTTQLLDVEGDYPTAGTYYAKITSAKFMNDETPDDVKFIAEDFLVTFNPAPISVKPKAENLSKTYGEGDDIYNIGYEITAVNGNPLSEDGYAGMAKDEIEAIVNAQFGTSFSFARAVFNADGTRAASADRRDAATNASHVTADGKYYAPELVGSLKSDDANFALQLDESYKDIRFDIAPREISLDVAKFVGISKDFDGNDLAYYAGNKLLAEMADQGVAIAYDISDQLLFGDGVSLTFNAKYGVVGSPEQETTTFIRFDSISLAGAANANYRIAKIVNSQKNGAKVNGTAVSPTDGEPYEYVLSTEAMLSSLTIEISLIDNNIDITDLENPNIQFIKITAGALGVWYEDIKVTKVYDGKTGLEGAKTEIDDRLAYEGTSNASPSILRQNSKITFPTSVNLGNGEETVNTLVDENVGAQKFVTLALLFTFDAINVSNMTIANGNEAYPEYASTDVKVQQYGGGILVYIPNFAVTVEQKVINGASFKELKYKSRAYNGLDAVELDADNAESIPFAEGAIVEKDISGLGLTLVGRITPGDESNPYGVGTHTVTFDDDPEYSSVANKNYRLDIADINKTFSGDNAITVDITPAQLVFNINFKPREYNGLADVTEDYYTLGATLFKAINAKTGEQVHELDEELKALTLAEGCVVTVTLSKDGKANQFVVLDANGNVLAHSVMISGVKLAETDDFNFDNYQLVGFAYVEGEATSVKLENGAEINDFEIVDAMELNKATVQVMNNYVTVRDKVYDGTRLATVDIPLPDDGSVFEGDRAFLMIKASGTFARKDVSTNIPVTIADNSAVMTAIDQEHAYLADNYIVKISGGSFSGNILARPVGVTVTFGEKPYDASAAIGSEYLTYTFDSTTMLSVDVNKYNVQTSGGAFFDDPNVAFSVKDGKTTIAKKDGTVYNPVLRDRQSANLSNYYLVATYEEEQPNMTLYAVLYVDENGNDAIMLAKEFEQKHPSASEGDALVAEEGEASGTPSESTLTVKKYFYELPSSDSLVKAGGDEEARAKSVEGAVIGYIDIANAGYWLVTSEYAELVKAGANAADIITTDALGIDRLSYIRAQGKINPQTLTIENGAAKLKKSAPFTKQYDGTNKFYGVLGTDYTFDGKALSGIKGDDDVSLGNIKGEFNSADTTATKIVFTGEPQGKSKDNYVLSEAATATLPASIEKRVITATLHDGEMTYGTIPSTVVGDISYDFAGKELKQDGKAFYMKFFDYLKVVGLMTNDDNATWGDWTSDDNLQYVKQLAADLYKGDVGEWTPFVWDTDPDPKQPSVDPDQYVYIKLSGDFIELPTARASFGAGTPNVGETARTYSLRGGNARNFTFAFKYEGGKPNTATLTVTPKDVYVSATVTNETVEYGGNIRNGRIAFYDEFGDAYSFAAGDTPQSLFVVNGVDYSPEFHWIMYYTGQPLVETPVKYPQPQAENSGIFYVGKFSAPEGVSYAKDGESKVKFNPAIYNYRFHFGHIAYDEVSNTCYIDYSYEYKGEGLAGEPGEGDIAGYRAYTTSLVITLPPITGITVQNNMTFAFDGDGSSNKKGTDKLLQIVSGLRSDVDAVAFQRTGGGTLTSIYNAGEYVGSVIVTRTLKWDSEDPGNTQIYQVDNIKLTVTKAIPSLSAADDSIVFNGKLYSYDYWKKVSGDLTLNNGEAEVSYEKLIGNVYYAAYVMVDGVQIPLLKDAEGYYAQDARGNRTYYPDVQFFHYTEGGSTGLKDVGAYRVTIVLNNMFANSRSDYQKTSIYAYVSITPREVEIRNIKLNQQLPESTDAQGAAIFSGLYDANMNYLSALTYDVQVKASDGELDPSAVIGLENTKVTGLDNVTSAGRYPFSIVLDDSGATNVSNYTFTSARGVLELRANRFLSAGSADSEPNDTVQFIEDSEKGVVATKMVVRHIKSTGGTGADTDLWNRVSTYMPSISKAATLAGIVQVKLYNGTTQINPSGETMSITIGIPENVDKSLSDVVVYVKNKDGGLDKLVNYTLENGRLTYVTDYLGEIVFVNLAQNGIPSWLLYTAIAVAAAVAAFVVWVIVAFAVRKSKLKKLV